MGCLCTQPTSTTINCGTCGYNCTSCVCPPDPIVMPTVTCEDPNPCNELYPLECVIYTGEDIKCSSEALMLYPNVIHFLVLEESSTTERNFVNILQNINEQLCYIFSKDFITQLLTNIQNDEELRLLFCNIISLCNCDCALTCPSVIDEVTYNSINPGVDTITIDFNQVTGGSTTSFTGSITGTTLTVTIAPSPINNISVGMKITGSGVASNTFITSGSGLSWTVSVSQSVPVSTVFTGTYIAYTAVIYRYSSGNYYYVNSVTSSVWGSHITFPSNTTGRAIVSVTSPYDNTGNQNWMVSVRARDMISGTECQTGYLVSNVNTPIEYSFVEQDCGVGIYRPPSELTCRSICIDQQNNPAFIVNQDGSLSFVFTTDDIPLSYYPVTKYTVHWYQQDTGGLSWTAQSSSWQYIHNGPYGTPSTVLTTVLTGTNINNNYLVLIFAETDDPECYSGFVPRLPIENPQEGYIYPRYTDDEIKNLNCNKFIYNIELPVIG